MSNIKQATAILPKNVTVPKGELNTVLAFKSHWPPKYEQWGIDMILLASLFKQKREQMGLSMRQMVEYVHKNSRYDISASTISRVERAHTGSIVTYARYAQILKLRITLVTT